MKEKMTIGGYTILERRQVGEVMIAVGHHPTAPAPYATWKAYEHSNFQSFNHGHYFGTKQEAMVDYFQRIMEAWENYVPAKNKQAKPEKSHQDKSPSR